MPPAERSPWRAFAPAIAWTALACVVLVGAVVAFLARAPTGTGPRGEDAVAARAAAAGAPTRSARPAAPVDPEVARIEARRAAGELSELHRHPGGCVVERVGYVDSASSRIHLVVERRTGGVEIRRWYDAAGRLVAAHAGAWTAVGGREQGEVAPAIRAVALEARDPSDALFGPPHGCGEDPPRRAEAPR